MVEVVVAIFILAIGVLAVASFFANSSRLARLASNQSLASNLAQGYIDQELIKSYDESIPGQSAIVKITNDSSSTLYNFSEQTTITLIDQNLNEVSSDLGLKKIEVAIFYQEGLGQKNVTLATIKTKK